MTEKSIKIINNLGIEKKDIDIEFIYRAEQPIFQKIDEDLELLKTIAEKNKDFKNLILVGYGGSNTSFLSYLKSLYRGDKKVYIINTIDPDYLEDIRLKCSIEETLIILVSKSGTTAGVLQTYFYFQDYKCIVITEDKENPLSTIAKKRGYAHIIHPPVGGRFSGRTSCAYFPALLLDINVDEIEKGFQSSYYFYDFRKRIDSNEILSLAVDLFLLEKRGYTEIFCPIYSNYLEGFQTLIMQLIHESSCKDEKGQTIYTALAPESQHHTNQRFFGGRKNVCGLFITVKDHSDKRIIISEDLKKIIYKGEEISFIDQLELTKALEYEFIGTYQNALDKNIPCAVMEISKITPYTIGYLLGTLHYLAVYSSMLRQVDPFNQPHVEDSKNITIELLKENSKLLRDSD
jgi:glucose-6-phosphate isomerase